MPSQGLQGKKFVGKIVEGFDPQQRGRYYVHIPDLMPHIGDNKGMLCPNETQTNRAANGTGGTSGSNSPLHPGFEVHVVCETDDISSARIVGVISDQEAKTDMGVGKTMGVEPSGQVVTAAVSGIPESTPFGSGGEEMMKQFSEVLNSGGQMAMEMLNSVKDKLGNIYDQITNVFSFKNIAEAIEKEVNFQAIKEKVEEAVESNKGATNQFDNATVDDSPIGSPENTITEEEKTQGYVGNEDEVIDKFLGPKEGNNSGD